MKACIVIPARYASSRLPGKVLLPIQDKPMLQWVYERAQKVRGVQRIVIATDDEMVRQACESFGAEVMMTMASHQSGTDRMGEIAKKLTDYSVFINMQGDEPMASPEVIGSVYNYFENGGKGIATLYESLTQESELFDYNNVKLVMDKNERVMYFSRSVIPAFRDKAYKEWISSTSYWRHVGIYGFDRESLLAVTALSPSNLELAESLEQLRWLENGFPITGIKSNYFSIGVDTAADLERVKDLMSNQN
ncbi:MAG: 3-deoxy-manno-octulosonate cytidylyltransferase [Saprospiraceae bacterium]|nr:3-deoxy-manno-octulosonate cytidylyltransferase [Saprospiraceae bacterium]